MLEVSLTERYKLSEGFVLHQIPELGQYWLFNVVNGEHYSLNEVSMCILQSLREGSSCNRLVQKLVEHYEVSYAEALGDVKEVLAEFLGGKIIMKDKGE